MNVKTGSTRTKTSESMRFGARVLTVCVDDPEIADRG